MSTFIFCIPTQYYIKIVIDTSSHSLQVNPLGTGDLKFYQSPGLSTFWGLPFFLRKPVLLIVMVPNSHHYSPLFKSSWPPDNNVIIFVAPPSA